MKILNLLMTSALLTLPALSPAATVIFQDSFESPPETVGSGNTVTQWDVSANNRIYAVNTFATTGTNSLFMRNSGSRTMTQTAAVDITGTDGLIVSWWMRQGSTYESNDTFSMKIDFGSGFQSVVADAGLADGGNYTYSGSENTLATDAGQTSSFTQYNVTIDSSYYIGTLAASDIKLQFLHSTGSGGEDGYFDDITITAIPEPSAFSMVVIGFAFILRFRRRR
ncbi:hypothetical protein P0Y35_18465 [Kiritimatiellaeota bacterium B1221]|nr:hypothetical protein [Kiritimatiellaeota bacterium B1221]